MILQENITKVISTRNYQDRLNTIRYVRESGIKVCSGGILGLGESREDRAKLLIELANLEQHPESVPINMLVHMEGTRLYDNEKVDELEFIRTIAISRIMMPKPLLGFLQAESLWQIQCKLCVFMLVQIQYFMEKSF